jgi:hypothetical protein
MNSKTLMLGNKIHKVGHGTVTVTPSVLDDIDGNPSGYEGLRIKECDLTELGFKPINRTSTVMWGNDIHLHLHGSLWVYEEAEIDLSFQYIHQLQNYLTLIRELV